jgi:hypothetical protein
MAEESASQNIDGETEELFKGNARRTTIDVESFMCRCGTRLKFQKVSASILQDSRAFKFEHGPAVVAIYDSRTAPAS